MSHLSELELHSLEQLLDQQERAAQALIRTEAGDRADLPFAELTGEVSDLGDEASADLIVDVDNAMMGLQLEHLRDIAAARQRLREQQYGICTDCQAEIALSRLQAYPTAKRCADCQTLHERTFASPSHARM